MAHVAAAPRKKNTTTRRAHRGCRARGAMYARACPVPTRAVALPFRRSHIPHHPRADVSPVGPLRRPRNVEGANAQQRGAPAQGRPRFPRMWAHAGRQAGICGGPTGELPLSPAAPSIHLSDGSHAVAPRTPPSPKVRRTVRFGSNGSGRLNVGANG